jgi:hypothetical protein
MTKDNQSIDTTLPTVGVAVLGASLAIYGAVQAILDASALDVPIVLRLGDRYSVIAIGSIWELGLFGGLLAILLVINVLLVWQLERRDWLWGKVVALLTLIMGALLFWAFQGMIAVN